MTKTMPITPRWLASLTPARLEAVDRKNNVLRGYVVAQEGPFKSRGRGEFDKQGLEGIMALGNAKEKGVKSRFTHPNESNDGLGKFLGRGRDLRMGHAVDERTGKRVLAVRADLHFNPTALDTPPNGGKPLGIYVMELAESDPSAISSSIVLEPEEVFRKNKDGSLATDKEGNELPPLWYPKALHASDIVDTGDAVDGLLSAGVDVDGLPLAAIWRAEEMLASVFDGQPREVIEARLTAYLKRYLDGRFGEPVEEVIEAIVSTPKLDARRLKLEEMDLAVRKMGAKRG
jgi:hypothetical protein